MLSDSQIERYSRQIILPQVGGKGQEKLLRARVLVNGSGPLQTAVLFYLAAAGVGTVGVITLAPSPVFSAFAPEQDDPITATLTRLNPDCTVLIHRPTEVDTPEQIVQRYDLALSPPDSLHEVCYALHKPFLCAQVSAVGAWMFPCLGYELNSPCLSCIPQQYFGEARETAPLAGLFLGTLLATEAIKFILGLSCPSGRLLFCQFPALHFSEPIVPKDPQCAVCGSFSR
jgi:molybdopterin-synthase adenylyltransferase